MTLADLRNLVWYWMDDLSGGYYTTTQVNLFLNNAQRETQKQLIQAGENYYLKPVETVCVVSQADYVFPSDFVESLRVEVVLSGTGINEDKRKLEAITLNEQDMVAANRTGTPMFYVIRKDRMTLYPAPDRAYTLRLWYSYRVTDMSADSDTPDVPQDFHEYLAILAAEDCGIKDDMVKAKLSEKKAFYLDLFKKHAEARDQSASRSVRTMGDEGLGSL